VDQVGPYAIDERAAVRKLRHETRGGEVEVDLRHDGAGAAVLGREATRRGGQRDDDVDPERTQGGDLAQNPCRAADGLHEVENRHAVPTRARATAPLARPRSHT